MTSQYPVHREIGGRQAGPFAAGSGQGAAHGTDLLESNHPIVAATVEFVILSNASGGAVPKGTAVKLASGGSALTFTTSTTVGDERICGVTLEAIAANARGRVALHGRVAQVRVASGSAVNQWLRQSGAAGVLTGVPSPTRGVVAIQTGTRNATTGLAEAFLLHQHGDESVEEVNTHKASVQNVNGTPLDETAYLVGVQTGGRLKKTLGPDEYFVLGDNRAESLDSRVFGPVPRDHIVGRVWVRGLPLSRVGAFETPEYNL